MTAGDLQDQVLMAVPVSYSGSDISFGAAVPLFKLPALSRNWAFDVNFMDATKLPPGTPQLLTTIRGTWQILPPNTIL